jgi:16S rRNA (guanine1207-N2)-methyltransferase
MRLEKLAQSKTLQDWLKTYTIQIDQQSLTICALPGVFSQDHLDVGTAVLLTYLQEVKSGKIADFGCGAGVISAYLAKLNPEQHIFALDVDAFALQSTKFTFEQNGLNLENLNLEPVTGFSDAPQDLDAIVSNPPFHQGIHTNYDASETLCRLAKSHLKSSGELWIVANRFLNYPPLIEQQFGQCEVKADQQGFKVLYACAGKVG